MYSIDFAGIKRSSMRVGGELGWGTRVGNSGGYPVAFALIGHAAWDTVHYVQNRVVARSYAEFCAVLDLLVGAAILLMA